MSTIVAFVARTALIAVLASLSQGQTFNVVYAFQGPPTGSNPFAGLVRDGKGNLYGTAETGGSGKPCGGCGAVFKLDQTGNVTWLYNFRGGADGEFPQAGVIRDQAGDLYGTTRQTPTGQGAVFKLTTKGSLTVLYRFTGGADGGTPIALPIRDQAGNLYGTANLGGDLSCNGGGGCGVVYRVTPSSGKETVLYSFKGKRDGAFPTSSLTMDRSGNLYGTVPTGGDTSCNAPYGCGIVFKLNRKGHEVVLHRFHGTGGDGSFPEAGLLLDAFGNLYGTTSEGGAHGGGIVFKINSAGRQTVLHNFNGYDGGYSVANLIMDKNGNLYGTTEYGGMGYGTVFKLDRSGKETVLHTFEYQTDGGAPLAPLVFENGSLYGTTSNWGPSTCNQYGCGTVFKITP